MSIFFKWDGLKLPTSHLCSAICTDVFSAFCYWARGPFCMKWLHDFMTLEGLIEVNMCAISSYARISTMGTPQPSFLIENLPCFMAGRGPMVYSRWWFQFFLCAPLFGGDEPILTFRIFFRWVGEKPVKYPFWKCSRTVSFEKELKTSMNLFGSDSDWTSQPVSVFYYPCCAATYLDKMCFCRKWTAGNPKMEVDGRWLSFSSLDDFGVPAVHFQVCVCIAFAQEFCFRDFWSSSCRSWSFISSCLATEFMP